MNGGGGGDMNKIGLLLRTVLRVRKKFGLIEQ